MVNQYTHKKLPNMGDIIDSNICCTCSGSYDDDAAGTGREWLQCQCGWWMFISLVPNPLPIEKWVKGGDEARCLCGRVKLINIQ